MANMTLAIPDELQEKLREHAEIRWSEVARQALEKKVADLEMMDTLTSNSKLTEKDVEEISAKINRAVAKKLGFK
jgi:predicted CopG family antitoxin